MTEEEAEELKHELWARLIKKGHHVAAPCSYTILKELKEMGLKVVKDE